MSHDFTDLGPLDPRRDAERWDALLRRTRAAAAPELARRRFASGPTAPLARWVRPALAMAAALVLAFGGALAMAGEHPAAQPLAAAAEPTVGEGMGVPTELAGWVEGGGRVRAENLLVPDPEGR